MAAAIRDTDYLVISARIRAMENQLLTHERMEQMLEARSSEETAKILQECGYPDLDPTRPEEMDAALSAAREAIFADLGDSAPDARYIDIFKIKYDYHNAKALLKAQFVQTGSKNMLVDMGRVPSAELEKAIQDGAYEELPVILAEGIQEAREILETTRDPQLSDVALDRWCYRDLLETAQETKSGFLTGYIRIQIDALNLRAMIRVLRMGKNEAFLRNVLIEGGNIDTDSLEKAMVNHGAGITELFSGSDLEAAAAAGMEALKGGALTEFERLCDDAVNLYVSAAKMIPFGEAPLVGYLAARETEYTNLRILLMGRGAGLPADVIRPRLRAGYL